MGKVRGQFVYPLLGYVLILATLVCVALAIGAGANWMVNHGIKPSPDTFEKWVGLTLMTLALFVFVVKQSRRFWTNRVFWATIGALLAIHTGTFLLILLNVEHWRLAWSFVICTIEVIPISAALDWTMARFGNRYRQRIASHRNRAEPHL